MLCSHGNVTQQQLVTQFFSFTVHFVESSRLTHHLQKMAGISSRTRAQLCLAVLGILVSAYAYYVETSKERDSSFQALCDINAKVSCSKVFTSK